LVSVRKVRFPGVLLNSANKRKLAGLSASARTGAASAASATLAAASAGMNRRTWMRMGAFPAWASIAGAAVRV
jgi:hypothetical protein